MNTERKTSVPKVFSFSLLLIAIFVTFTFLSPPPASGAVWYVSAHGSTSGDGTTWSTAFKNIQESINAASDSDEIWVKKGTYRLSSQIDVDRVVNLYGGFAGTETNRDERDWAANLTTIDGQDSVFHCFFISKDATIDGLTITGGNANGSSSTDYLGGGIYNFKCSPCITNCTVTKNSAFRGSGIFNMNSSPTITNCTFSENNAVNFGGGMHNEHSSPTITSCTFSKNETEFTGGGIYNFESSPIITNCSFLSNTAGYVAGGIGNFDSSSPTISNCIFSGNSAGEAGGGITNFTASSPTITNCTVTGNGAEWGGGIANGDGSSPTITNCTFSDNNSELYGGGIVNAVYSSPTITNCILWGDTAPDGPEIQNGNTSNPTITYCDIQGGYEGEGNMDSDPRFSDPSNNDFHITSTSPCIDEGNNNALGIYTTDFEGDPRIADGDNDGIAKVDIGADEYIPLPMADGDVAPLGNRDGIVNVGDALVALRFALTLEIPTSEDIVHGDVAPLDEENKPSPDGVINVGDALVILRKALGIISF